MQIGHLVRSVWSNYSLLRAYENEFVKSLRLSGSGIDLGAKSRDAKYYEFINLDNVDQMEFVDYFHAGDGVIKMDIEKTFPITDEQYDFVLSFNVMEHIFDHRNMISETARILKRGGAVHGIVPLMWHYHPDPNDYFRFTGQALERLLQEYGFENIVIKPLACGPFKVAASQVGNVARIRLLRLMIYLAGVALDRVLSLASTGGENYAMAYYFSGVRA